MSYVERKFSTEVSTAREYYKWDDYTGQVSILASDPLDPDRLLHHVEGQKTYEFDAGYECELCAEILHKKSLTFCSLPRELKLDILELLNIESPIASRVRGNPEEIIDGTGKIIGKEVSYALKNASCVSKEWRAICFPLLFRHITWTPPLDDVSPIDDGPPTDVLTRFLGTTNFVVPMGKPLRDIVEGFTVMAVKPPMVNFDYLKHNLSKISRDNHGQQISHFTSNSSEPLHTWTYGPWVEALWTSIFKHIDPLRITILGRPWEIRFILHAPASPHNYLNACKAVFQISRVRKCKDANYINPHPGYGPAYMRPWTQVLLNEGYPYSCHMGLLLCTHLYFGMPPRIRHFTYINQNPISVCNPAVISRIPCTPFIDLVIGPQASAGPLCPERQAIGWWKKGVWHSNYCLRVAARGRMYGMMARALVTWSSRECPFLFFMQNFRIRTGSEEGAKPWREFLRLIMHHMKKDHDGRMWVPKDDWLVKVRGPLEDFVPKPYQ